MRWKLAETAWAKMSDVDDDYDFLQKLRDASGDLLAKVATGELSRKDAERELHIMRAFCELISMVKKKMAGLAVPARRGGATASNHDRDVAGSVSPRRRQRDRHAP